MGGGWEEAWDGGGLGYGRVVKVPLHKREDQNLTSESQKWH